MLSLTKSNKKEFSTRVKRTFAEFPVEEIDKAIDSMQKGTKLITKNCGKRIKY